VERIKAILAHGARRERPLLRVAALTAGIALLALSGYAGSFALSLPASVAAAPEKAEPRAPNFPSAAPQEAAVPPQAPAPVETSNLAAAKPLIAERPTPSTIDPVPTIDRANVAASIAAPVAAPSPKIADQPLPGPIALATPVVPRADNLQPTTGEAGKARSNPRLVAQANPTSVSDEAGKDNGRGIQVFDISKLDQIPVPTSRVAPQYPLAMRRSGIQGEVLVDFIVTTSGDVANAFAFRSSKHDFEAAAVTAVSRWKFRPGRKGGRAVNTHMQVPILFTLNDN
jgi:protein TonB